MPIAEIILGTSDRVNHSFAKGWAVGYMQDSIARTSSVEVKMWDYPEPFDYGKKAFGGTEFISISGGVLRLELDLAGETQTVILKASARDYVVIPPGVVKKVIVQEAPAWGVTVRWPSGPDVNKKML